MKKFISIFMVVSLVLLSLGGGWADASGERPMVFKPFGKSMAKYVPGEIIVKFKNDTKPFRVVKIPKYEVKEKVEEYSNRLDVVYAEPNYYAQTFVDDPLYASQWHLHGPDEGGVNAEAAWSVSTGSEVIVAIIDTGIAYENDLGYEQAPDLEGTRFAPGYDFVNDDMHPNDDESHGTHVAGTVAQATNNGRGVAGVASDAILMPVKVLDDQGVGTYDNIARGIRFAADHNAKVINLSLGGSVGSATLQEAVAYAYNKGVTIVAASGNDGKRKISYPAAYNQYVIAVGATRYDKTRAIYSNYGIGLDLVAPGGDIRIDQNGDGDGDGILQNTFNPYTKDTNDFGYWFFQGTSMASPHVAGVAALLIANGNATEPDDVRKALEETALDLGTAGWDKKYGHGLVDAAAALNWSGVTNAKPSANNQVITTDEDASVPITLTGSDSEVEAVLIYTIVTEPDHGTLTGDAPDVLYTPDENYYGMDSFTFKVNDGQLDSNTATVEITIYAVNDPPLAQHQEFDVVMNTPLTIVLVGSDPDTEDVLSYSVVANPDHGTLTGDAPNLIYTPVNGYLGPDSFIYEVADDKGATASGTVNMAVNEVQLINVSTDVTIGTKKAGKNTFVWAEAKVNVGDAAEPFAGAVVTGNWYQNDAYYGSASGITGADGIVLFRSEQVKLDATQTITFTFVVGSVSIEGIDYTPTGVISQSAQYPGN